MKNLIVTLFVLSIALISCDGGTVKRKTMDEFVTVIIEDCEYMYHAGIGYRSMVHKGNCANPIHDCSKTDTLVVQGPIDSAEVAIGYLRTNMVIKE